MLDSARQQVKDVKLTCTRPWQQSFLSGLTSMEGLLRVRIIQMDVRRRCTVTDSPSSEEPSWKLCRKNHPVCALLQGMVYLDPKTQRVASSTEAQSLLSRWE